jgi:metabolite-proton symporter
MASAQSARDGTRTADSKTQYRRLLLASCFGTAVEWYDFFVYGFLAPLVFNQLFFPKLDPLAGTLAVFATFGVGFLARPLGGILFGHFGDRVGRKSILLVTLMLMGLGTAAIGLLPTYAQAGVLAPVLLVTLRFLQGFALGGESIGALLLTVEGSPAHRRGWYGALIQASGPAAVVAASLAVSLVSRLPDGELLSWGWRVPFWVSLLLVLLGLYVRLKIKESPVFADALARGTLVRVPLLEILRRYRRATLVTFFICLAETSFYYLTAVYVLSYGTKILGLPRTLLTTALLIANTLALFTVPLFGALSDRVGRRPLFLLGLIATALYLPVFFLLLDSKDALLVTGAMVLAAGIIHPSMFGPEGSFFSELFDTRVRFSGVSFGKQLGTVLGGGSAPLVATSLYAWHGSTDAVVAYFTVFAVLAVVAVLLAPETHRRPALDQDEQVPNVTEPRTAGPLSQPRD